MSSVLSALGSIISDFIDAVVSFVKLVWDEIAMPILEFVFGIFGIEDETVIQVQKVSTALYSSNDKDVVASAKARAVISFIQSDSGFLSNYIREIYTTKGQIKGFYNYAERGKYIHGLPTMEIRGGEIDYSEIDSAINTDLGGEFTILSVNTTYPSGSLYYKNNLQNDSEYNYIPNTNTLTYTDPYGVSYSDYTLDSIVFNAGSGNYDITVSRVAVQALFWIEGPLKVTEGKAVNYTIKCNRVVPLGEQVTINFSYSGSAVNLTDYTQVSSVVMSGGSDTAQVSLSTIDNIISDVARDIVITVSSITNTNSAFEAVDIYIPNSITTNILDNDSIVLTLDSLYVNEASTSITIPVTNEQEVSLLSVLIPFTVDYAFTDITTLGGVDYDNTVGTLSFTGSAGEVQNIVVPLTADIPNGDKEQFEVYLINCSEASVDITRKSTVTIVDSENATPSTVLLSSVFSKPNFVDTRTLITTYHDNLNPTTDWYFWLYDLSLNTYPLIDPKATLITGTEMLPIAILRSNKINVNVDKTTDEYKTTKRLLDYLKLDIEELITNLDSNSYVDDVTDVYINLAINPSDTNSVISKLLWLSFNEIIVVSGLLSNTNEYVATFVEQDVNNSIVWSDQVVIPNVSGSIGPKDTYTHTIGSVVTSVPNADDPDISTNVTQKTLTLRHQKDSSNYEEIVLTGLSSMSAIAYDGYHNLSVSDLGDDNFTIPLSLFVFDSIKAEEQLEVYQYLLRLDLFALKVVEIEWYQTAAFASLFKFVAIVITIVTFDFSGGIYGILEQLVINYLVGELVVFIALKTGNAELAAILGLVAVIAFSDSGAKMFDFTSAEQLLKLGTSFADNLTKSYSAQAQDIASDITDLTNLASSKLDAINDLSEGLNDSPIDIDFLIAVKSVDTTAFPAINGQYQFDEVYNYDKLISNFHDNMLTKGVI